MLESAIVSQLQENVKKLQKLGYPIRIIKVHGGMFTSGEPDIIGCYDGQFFAWEMKNEQGRATSRQLASLKKWADAGGKTGIYRDSVTPLIELNPEWAEILVSLKGRKKSSAPVTIENLSQDGGFN